MKILLIEDAEAMRTILKFNLEDYNYIVEEARNGAEALLKINNNYKPDIIITDLMMPGMDGFTFIKEFKTKFKIYNDVKIIVLSAKNRKDDVLKAIELGANEYIIKPFEIKDIIETIKKFGEKING